MFPKPLVQIIQQPDYLLDELDDLLRFKEGELLGFLLQLSPEQERFVSWAIRATGPTQLKGGPGTGKSTVALYRVRSLLQKLLKMGEPAPHILFTTYTNALIKSSEQLLRQLLGEDARYIEVRTADGIAKDILGPAAAFPRLAEQDTVNRLLRQAVAQAKFEGNVPQKQAQQQAFVRFAQSEREEIELLARFLQGAAREFRLGLGACAVFCPTEKSGEAIAARLFEHGMSATFMKGRELDLLRPGIKVLTLNSSKGLEFPVVALAGFSGSRYALVHAGDLDEERKEELARERRTMFVGMTRAMRALLVVVPAQTRSPLLTGLDERYWNVGGKYR